EGAGRAARRAHVATKRAREGQHVSLHSAESGRRRSRQRDPEGLRMAEKFILIVEDNERNAKLIRDVLQVTGYRVAHCVTAEDGLDLVQRDRPDLILMDIQLPGIRGSTALQHLQSDPRTRDIPAL